jgi:chromosomal replication initiator protein DnaA
MSGNDLALWEHCINQLKAELTSAEFNTWILPLQARVDGSLLSC